MKRLIVIVALVTACATPPDLPEEAQDADGVGGATAKVEFVKWLGQLLLTAVGNITVNVKVEAKDKNDCSTPPVCRENPR